MVANPSKFQLKFRSKYKSIEKEVCLSMEKPLKSSDTVKLFGITLDKDINFKPEQQNHE